MKHVLEEIVKHLQDKNLSIVAERTDISYNTLKNIRDGGNTNPTLNVLSTLYIYLEI